LHEQGIDRPHPANGLDGDAKPRNKVVGRMQRDANFDREVSLNSSTDTSYGSKLAEVFSLLHRWSRASQALFWTRW